jgi:hypothetical protein
MARGKFNKRGGGKKFDCVSAEEIELRNKRLEEFEEQRAKRRAEEGEDEEGEAGEKKEEGKEGDATEKPASGKPKPKPEEDEKPVIVTSAEDHRRNMRKLDAVRKRREEAEMRRLAEQATEMAVEKERKLQFAAFQADDEEDDKTDKKKKKKEKATIAKLTKIDIKKMKPAQMKDALKERGLEIQGNKNELTERLVKFEADR